MPSRLKLKKHGACGTIILDRPEKRNALSRELIDQLREALEDFHLERSVRCVMITGSGSAFCSGIDLEEVRETFDDETRMAKWHEDAVRYRGLLDAILQFPKPVIAAVNGPAVGAGAALVLACDIALACEQATYGFPEPRRGVVSGLSAPLLQFRIGGGRASYLLTTARTVDASQAFAWGIYHELLGEAVLWARGNELTSEIAKSAPESIQLTKKTLNETVGEQLGTQLASGAAASAASKTTESAEEGVRAFLEKREPKWP